MIEVILALMSSLAQSKGGKIGALFQQLVATFQAVQMSIEQFQTQALPWITWANSINDANRDPTDDEHAAALAFANAVYANNSSLANGGDPLPLPSPPTA